MELKMNNVVKVIIICIVLIFFIISIYFLKNVLQNKTSNFSIYFFNAGKADCILISNNDKYIMIDTGEESLSDEILEYFKNNNITKLDYLIITHFDKDHVGSASAIIDNIQIDNVLQSNYPKESVYYENYLNSLSNKNITPKTISGDETFFIGNMKMIVNGPTVIYDSNESNNSSLIVSIKCDNFSYLFMGDSQNSRIKDYLSNHNEQYDFIKIPYHGNYQKRLIDLLNVVKPQYAVITCSDFEPDVTETVKLLEELSIKYYLTKDGEITVKSGSDITFVQ